MNTQQQDYLRQVTTTTQIILGALIMGVVVFAGIVLFLNLGGDPVGDPEVEQEAGVLAPMAADGTLIALVAAVLIPRIVQASHRRKIAAGKPFTNDPRSQFRVDKSLGDVGWAAASFQTILIIGAAILEGAAFFNLIAYMIEHQLINLACAALLVVAIMFKFPTRNGIDNFVADELKQIEELRSLGN